MTISKQLSGKHSSMIAAFLKSRLLPPHVSSWEFFHYFWGLLLVWFWRSSLPEVVLEKTCSLYIWRASRKTKGIELNFFSAEVLKFSQLLVLNSFIQEQFSPWCKVNWMENFLKFRLFTYLVSCQISMMQLFFGDGGLLLAVLFSQKRSIILASQISECVSKIYLIF